MPIDWFHASPTFVAAFLASTVESIEALTVVLAVGSVRGWRSALVGSIGALGFLALIVAFAGTALARIPLHALQLVVGILLLLFGIRWLDKAIARASGVAVKHDEAAIYARQREQWRDTDVHSKSWDAVAGVVAFKSVVLEGTEVVFIVLALVAGHADLLLPASAGAFAAVLLVSALGVALHRPLTRVPENTLKFVVGVLLLAFGTFWVGEGMHATWPGGNWAILGLATGYLLVAMAAVGLCRHRSVAVRPPSSRKQGRP